MFEFNIVPGFSWNEELISLFIDRCGRSRLDDCGSFYKQKLAFNLQLWKRYEWKKKKQLLIKSRTRFVLLTIYYIAGPKIKHNIKMQTEQLQRYEV